MVQSDGNLLDNSNYRRVTYQPLRQILAYYMGLLRSGLLMRGSCRRLRDCNYPDPRPWNASHDSGLDSVPHSGTASSTTSSVLVLV